MKRFMTRVLSPRTLHIFRFSRIHLHLFAKLFYQYHSGSYDLCPRITTIFQNLKQIQAPHITSEVMPASWSPYHPTYHPSSTLAKNPLFTQPPFSNLQTQETPCEATQSSATLICCDCTMPTYSTV
jgi:hypothetical protein